MKVYYDASLFGHGGAKRRHAGQPLALEARFDWGGGHFYVPAIYLCAQGIVLDLLERLDRTRIEAFYEKWRWAQDREPTRQEQLLLEYENPAQRHIRASLCINGKTVPARRSSSGCWLPWIQQGADRALETVCDQYGCSRQYAWTVTRFVFPWATRRRPRALSSLSLSLCQTPALLPAAQQFTTTPGCAPFDVAWTHPQTGEKSVLHVWSAENETLPPQSFGDAPPDPSGNPAAQQKIGAAQRQWAYPRCYTTLCYTAEPEPAGLLICDAQEGDRPRRISAPEPGMPESLTSCAIGIIGGADGPCVLAPAGAPRPARRYAASALRFEPAPSVCWQIQVQETQKAPELTLWLIKRELI